MSNGLSESQNEAHQSESGKRNSHLRTGNCAMLNNHPGEKANDSRTNNQNSRANENTFRAQDVNCGRMVVATNSIRRQLEQKMFTKKTTPGIYVKMQNRAKMANGGGAFPVNKTSPREKVTSQDNDDVMLDDVTSMTPRFPSLSAQRKLQKRLDSEKPEVESSSSDTESSHSES